MNSLKTLVIVIVLIGLAYLVSKKIMLGPEDGSSEDWGSFSEEFSFQGTSAPEEFAGPESPPQMDLAMGDEPSSIWNSPTTPIEAAAPPPADSFVGSAMPAQPDASATASPPVDASVESPSDGDTQVGAISGPDPSLVRPVVVEFLNACRQRLDQGDFDAIHQTLSEKLQDDRFTAAEKQRITELLDQVAGTVIFSTDHIMEAAYQVRVGDTLERIARMQQVPPGLLMKINGLSRPEDLVPGMKIKVVRGPFDATVDLSEGEMTLGLHGRYAGRFPVETNPNVSGLEGSYKVQRKVGETEATRWLDLGDPIRIQGAASDEAPGAIVLGERDIEDVCDILSVESRVTIQR